MSKSPTALVKHQFGDKAKLVAALGPLTSGDLWIDRVNETKGLERVSNAKLLRLYSVLTAVKEKFGTRAKLVDAICEIEKRSKDEGFKKRLLAYPVPRLFDTYRSAAKRAGVKVDVKPAVVSMPASAPKASNKVTKVKEAKAAAKPANRKPAASKSAPKKSASKAPAAKKK
jgi:hypothetical protein